MRMRTREEKMVSQTASWDFKPQKKQWASALLSVLFVRKPLWKSHASLN